ncbi:MAG: hypothetical protein PUC37_02390 [Spirochaetales bacterium]|nr:hypothetical protein [Spirochaetales bacterium]
MEFDSILKEPFYNFGWCYSKTINFFGKENNVQFVFEAYPESEKINTFQKETFMKFYENINELSNSSSNQLNDYIKKYVDGNYTIANNVILKEILIKSDGETILLCEVDWDIENGLCIKVMPEYDIGPQDVFL